MGSVWSSISSRSLPISGYFMRPVRRHAANLLRTSTLGVCALLLNAAFATDAAASCGDWLADGSMSAEHGANETRHHVSLPAGPRKTPCQGAECRRAPQNPLPQSPSRSLTLEEDRWCQMPAYAVTVPTEHDSPLVERTLILPAPPHSRLERPPRI